MAGVERSRSETISTPIARLRAYVPVGEDLAHFIRRSLKTRLFATRARARLRWRKPTPIEQDSLRSLRHRMGALQPTSVQGTESWVGFTTALRESARTRDPRAFLTWPVVRSTMFAARDSPWVALRLDALRGSPRWQGQWSGALIEDPCGSPEPYSGWRSTSGTLIQHAYHLEIFEQHTGERLQDFGTIIEFGGGYGSMCRLVHRLGFSGNYVIQDLPELNELQQYFLQSVGTLPKSSVTFVSDPAEAEKLCADPLRPAALIATWSLSEAPIPLRDRVLAAVSGFDAFLFTYQTSFDGMDNGAYFASISERFPEITWKDIPCEGLPVSRYLLGHRTRN